MGVDSLQGQQGGADGEKLSLKSESADIIMNFRKRRKVFKVEGESPATSRSDELSCAA